MSAAEAEAAAAAAAAAADVAAASAAVPVLTGASSAGAPLPAHSMGGAQSRDCCIDMFERVGCAAPPEGNCVGGCDGDCAEFFCKICEGWLFPRSWRVLNWFCAPYEACCGWGRRITDGCCIPSVLALPLCLPCLVCLALSRCVRSCKGMCSDAAFNAIYIPLLCLALSFRWLWENLCCARSFCCLLPGPCGPGCEESHDAYSRCLVCGDRLEDHGSHRHTCYDGRRGSYAPSTSIER